MWLIALTTNHCALAIRLVIVRCLQSVPIMSHREWLSEHTAEGGLQCRCNVVHSSRRFGPPAEHGTTHLAALPSVRTATGTWHLHCSYQITADQANKFCSIAASDGTASGHPQAPCWRIAYSNPPQQHRPQSAQPRACGACAAAVECRCGWVAQKTRLHLRCPAWQLLGRPARHHQLEAVKRDT